MALVPQDRYADWEIAVISGGMTVAAIPMYESMDEKWVLAIMAGLSALLVPIPYLFYLYGVKIRSYSKYAANQVRVEA